LRHHLLAYVEMFARDAERMADVRRASTACRWAAPRWPAPPTRWTASAWRRTLGMDGPAVCQNSLDAVSDRDFAIEFTAAASLCMVHVSRLSEELILWMSQNFGFIKIADRFTPARRSCRRRRTPTCPNWRAARPAAWSAT
jgi:argininosuccinate lyase